MTKQQAFVEWFDELMSKNPKFEENMPEDVKAYMSALRDSSVQIEKPDFTDNGKAILKYLQEVPVVAYKARDIAEGMFIASKSVSGTMRKLVNDGYEEKIGQNTVVYMITEKGKNVIFENEGENE